MPAVSMEEDMKRVWKAVLACGQAMGRELEQKESKPLLSDVMSFIRNAHGLASPEESFGTRHIVVEGISESMHTILDHVSKAHDAQAKLLDMLYDEENEGVDLDAVRKYMNEVNRTISIRLDEMSVLENQLELAAEWQSRLDSLMSANDSDGDSIMTDDRDDLAAAEQLLADGSTLGIRSRGVVQLEKQIEKAYQLRDRLRAWQKVGLVRTLHCYRWWKPVSNAVLRCMQSQSENKKESIKFISGLVRDANRLNLNFPEVSELFKFHRTAEDWVDRANVAVRSRISLTEIESLINRAEEMPLDLSEFSEKLQSRVRLTQSWISHFQDLVPAPFEGGKVDNLAWMSRMRKALLSEDKRFLVQLHDVATEGTRIPVEIDCVKLLLIEIDAKNWSAKAKKWIPLKPGDTDDAESTTGGKRAKLVDIRDHLEKADTLREKLVLPPGERDVWVLDGEAELKSIIEAADDWFEKVRAWLLRDYHCGM